jgi:hemolysin activation/secretion protein
VTPVLRAGAVPGTVDVDLGVQERLPVHASVEVNDRYTADTSRTRVNVNFSYDNLLQKFHRLSLQYQVAPEEPDESRVLAATYVAPVGPSTLLAGYVVDTKSDFATLSGLGPLGILGTGRIYGLRYIRLLPEWGRLSSSFTLGVDRKDFEDVIEQPDGALDVTPMEYVHWSAVWGGSYRGDSSLSTHSVGVNFGLRGLGNSSDEFAYKRYKAEPDYFYLRAEASHERPLPGGTRLFVRAAAQAAAGPLISNEQFSLGGAGSVRGYLEAEQLGDNGVFGNLELRSPRLSPPWPEALPATYVFGFADAGIVGVLEPLPVDGEKTNRYSLSSAGVGLRMGDVTGLQAELEWAYPFESSDNVEQGDSRLHFQVMYGF